MMIEANKYAVCCHNNAFDNERISCTKNCDCGSPCKDHAYFDPKGLCVENMNKKLERLLFLLQEHRHIHTTFTGFTDVAQLPNKLSSGMMYDSPKTIKW